jgi:uncharacterized protein with NRDE domain
MSAFLSTPDVEAYEGFNALFLQPRNGGFEVGYISNKPPQARTLQVQGSRGLSNTVWDEPWPKVLQGQEQVDELIERGLQGQELVDALFALMRYT